VYISYKSKSYKQIKSLSFSPEVDIIGNELVVNEFRVEIITDDDVTIGKYAGLFDDSNKLWAVYRITEAQRLSPHSITIKAQSDILILDRKKLPAQMCEGESAKTLINQCFTSFGLTCVIDSSVSDLQINGYLPEQSARQRLQWLCFVIGAYVQSFFTAKCTIKKIDNTVTNIPMSKTFYRPKISYKDYVTAVTATSYNYTEGTPGSTDKWVKVGNKTYIQTSQTASLSNSDVPANTPNNIIDLSNITIVNDSNISSILQRLAAEYFNREQLTADIINTYGEIQPADKVSVFDGIEDVITGYVKSTRFTFGKAAKSAIVLTQTVTEKAVRVVLSYRYLNIEIAKETFMFPKNTAFELENSYIDTTEQGLRRVYLPLTEKTTGNTGNKEITTKNVNCNIALEFKDNILDILSVDSANKNDSEVVIIA
jgi:hypothetical protein